MKRIIRSISVSLAVVCGVANAVTPEAKTGFVLGLQGGYAQNNLNYSANLVKVREGNLYGGVNLGFRIALSHFFALGAESGLFYGKDISKIEKNDGATKVSNLMVPIFATANFVSPVGIGLLAKAGIAYLHPSVSKSGSSVTTNWSSSWRPIAAAGISYTIGSLALIAQYTHVFGKKGVNIGSDTRPANIDAYTLGIEYTLSVF